MYKSRNNLWVCSTPTVLQLQINIESAISSLLQWNFLFVAPKQCLISTSLYMENGKSHYYIQQRKGIASINTWVPQGHILSFHCLWLKLTIIGNHFDGCLLEIK